MAVLNDVRLRPVRLDRQFPYEVRGLAIGGGQRGLEVLVCQSNSEPNTTTIRSLWDLRCAGRAIPLLVIVEYGDKIALCGPAGEKPPVELNLDPGQVDRICRDALEQPDPYSARLYLRDTLPALQANLAGVRNEGFLASHEISYGLRQHAEWDAAGEQARRLIGREGRRLIEGLGFNLQRIDNMTSVLVANDRKSAVAVLLQDNEAVESRSGRFSTMSPIAYALAVADRENLPYVLVEQRGRVRLYPTQVGVGVGRRGRAETFIECHTRLLRDSDAAYLWMLFSGEALAPGGTLEQALEESTRYAGHLADQLRQRIYDRVVPRLASGVTAALEHETAPDKAQLDEIYQAAMLLLFRCLFIAYAEDRDLLPYRWNGLYRKHSLKAMAQELLEIRRQQGGFGDDPDIWHDLKRVFRAVDKGKPEWGVPEYNGGLFSPDPDVSSVGALLEEIELPDSVLGPALSDLLLVDSDEEGPVDFRSLGVREFGTVYEGLLESELSVADTDLTLDKKGGYLPAKKGAGVVVREGEIYLHNKSGVRKSTGSYFTPPFAVQHLLDEAVTPALKRHFERLDDLDDDAAAAAFFDFRVADISCGSGHFLVAAVDHLEQAMADYLTRRQLPGVDRELAKLRQAADESLGDLSAHIELDNSQIMRRQIARRCIYGVDLNPIAVSLAQVAIWLHTFVAGLPLSFLNRNLVVGNSLVGIGRLQEIRDVLSGQDRPLLPFDPSDMIEAASEPLSKLAKINDATIADIRRAYRAWDATQDALRPARTLCDLITASRIAGKVPLFEDDDWKRLVETGEVRSDIQALLNELGETEPFHFPVAFPEVFMRERSGFDAVVGNPPWDEPVAREHAFWARHFPGFRALSEREKKTMAEDLRNSRPDLVKAYEAERADNDRLRKMLSCGVYPGMGTGDPDLYKGFTHRFWELLAQDGGVLGVVLPRSALTAMGSTDFRHVLFNGAATIHLTTILNNRRWFFTEVHPQYTIALLAVTAGSPGDNGADIYMRGPYRDRSTFDQRFEQEPAHFTGTEIQAWNDAAALPLLPSDQSPHVFAQLRKAPRLDANRRGAWRAVPVTELHSTQDKPHMDLDSAECPDGFWPVYKGSSFDIWSPDTGSYYAWSNPDELLPHLDAKRRRSRIIKTEMPPDWLGDPETLPCRHPRIAYRRISRSTDTRTVRSALIPGGVFLNDAGPYLLWPRGDERDQAYLLGILCSIPLDWYARRFVEANINFFVFNPFPVPRPPRDNVLWKRVVEVSGRLAACDDRFADWAVAVGVECGPLEDDEKTDLIHELDALSARLYGLREYQLQHIFETFHEGWDFTERWTGVRDHFWRLGRSS